jgi:hypothetical protein
MSVAHLFVDPVTSASGEQETITKVMPIKTAKRHMKLLLSSTLADVPLFILTVVDRTCFEAELLSQAAARQREAQITISR